MSGPLVAALFAVMSLWPGFTPLYDDAAAPGQRLTPLLRGLTTGFLLLFLATGWAYGAVACASMWFGASDALSPRAWAAVAGVCAVLAVARGAFSDGRAYDGALVALIAAAVSIAIFALQGARIAVPTALRACVRRHGDSWRALRWPRAACIWRSHGPIC